jgi:hypothetical protein
MGGLNFGCECADWINLAQVRDRWRTVLNTDKQRCDSMECFKLLALEEYRVFLASQNGLELVGCPCV